MRWSRSDSPRELEVVEIDPNEVKNAATANPPIKWEYCLYCDRHVSKHLVMNICFNEACENFDFCEYEMGSWGDGNYARYIFPATEAEAPMSREDFEELYS